MNSDMLILNSTDSQSIFKALVTEATQFRRRSARTILVGDFTRQPVMNELRNEIMKANSTVRPIFGEVQTIDIRVKTLASTVTTKIRESLTNGVDMNCRVIIGDYLDLVSTTNKGGKRLLTTISKLFWELTDITGNVTIGLNGDLAEDLRLNRYEVLAGNGSKDGTRELAEKICSEDYTALRLERINAGLADTMNISVRLTNQQGFNKDTRKFDYICSMYGDDNFGKVVSLLSQLRTKMHDKWGRMLDDEYKSHNSAIIVTLRDMIVDEVSESKVVRNSILATLLFNYGINLINLASVFNRMSEFFVIGDITGFITVKPDAEANEEVYAYAKVEAERLSEIVERYISLKANQDTNKIEDLPPDIVQSVVDVTHATSTASENENNKAEECIIGDDLLETFSIHYQPPKPKSEVERLRELIKNETDEFRINQLYDQLEEAEYQERNRELNLNNRSSYGYYN